MSDCGYMKKIDRPCNLFLAAGVPMPPSNDSAFSHCRDDGWIRKILLIA